MSSLLEYVPQAWRSNQKPNLKQVLLALGLLLILLMLGLRFSLQSSISGYQLTNNKLQARLNQAKTQLQQRASSVTLDQEHQRFLNLLELITTKLNADLVLTEIHWSEDQLLLTGLARSADEAKQYAESLAANLKLADFSLSENTTAPLEFKLRFLSHD